MALVFRKLKGFACFTAQTPTAAYRVSRSPLGRWGVRVDGKLHESFDTKVEAIALANTLHEDATAEADALVRRAAFRVVTA